MMSKSYDPILEALADRIGQLTILQLKDLQGILLERGIEIQVSPAPAMIFDPNYRHSY